MKNIKISETAHRQLKGLALDVGCSMGRLVEAIIRKATRDAKDGRVILKPMELNDVDQKETINI